jgi:hypothetical protein
MPNPSVMFFSAKDRDAALDVLKMIANPYATCPCATLSLL